MTGPGPGRRGLLGAATGAGTAAALGLLSSRASAAPDLSTTGSRAPGPGTVPYWGDRQHGVTTPPPQHARWVALDLAERAGIDDLRRALRVWTDDAARLTQGRPGLTDQAPELAASPHHLTVTVGLTRSAFERVGRPDLAPGWLRELPRFTIDALEKRWCGGHVVLQLCSDSASSVQHASRVLLGGATGIFEQRWVQTGYREPTVTPTWQAGRNAFGQVDGTVQPSLDGPEDDLVWHGAAAGRWADSTALVLRRIAMNLETWEGLDRGAREHAIGRRLTDGAPLTGGDERTPPDLDALDEHGLPVIDEGSHMRRAMPRSPRERFLRRPYTYDGESGTGLLFAAYCADPEEQLVPVQRRLAEADLLNIWTTTVGSVVAAVLPGVHEGEYLGQRILGG